MPPCTHAFASIMLALSILASTEAMASAQRTFVASYGNDANPCSLVLPCRGFSAAVAQTIAGGEVIVLDSAGYGPVTIAQSASIIAPAGVYAGISVPTGATGVTINGPGINVLLRGLTITSPGGGSSGVVLVDGSELTIEDCELSHFDRALEVWAYGASTVMNISRMIAHDNNYGVIVKWGATANISNSQILTSGSAGIIIWGGLSLTSNVFIADTLVTGNKSGLTRCIDDSAGAGGTGNMSITRVTVTGCDIAIGILSAGLMTISNSMVSGNNTAFAQSGPGAFHSLGNNHLSSNTNDTVGTITTIGAQ